MQLALLLISTIVVHAVVVTDDASLHVNTNGTTKSMMSNTTSTEFPPTVITGNYSANVTELLVNWLSFKNRFALQCVMVFIVLLCVMLLCFIPDEPMFDITYNKYDTNEIAKLTSGTSLKTSLKMSTGLGSTVADADKHAAAFSGHHGG